MLRGERYADEEDNIPARPFLGLSDEDMQEIKATTEEFIGRDD